MPKAIIDSVRGVNQTAGTGFVVTGMPIDHFGDGVTYTHLGTVPATTDVALVAATQSSHTTLNLANGAYIGAKKTIMVTSVGGGEKLRIAGVAGIHNIDDAANYPETVTEGEVIHCVYVATGRWFLTR